VHVSIQSPSFAQAWPGCECRRVFVVLASGSDPADAMRVAVAAASAQDGARVSIAVVGGAWYWPQWASVDGNFWMPLETVREETFCRGAEHVPDEMELRLLDTPGWDAVRGELLARRHDLVVCGTKQRWASRTLTALAGVPVVVVGRRGAEREPMPARARPASQA
jgi:hypothetical protein